MFWFSLQQSATIREAGIKKKEKMVCGMGLRHLV